MFRDYKSEATCMAWGMTCGDGWFDLVRETARRVVALDSDAVALQVKEKLGGLSFHIVTQDRQAREICIKACDASQRICEECGCPGSLREDLDWILTLCEECLKKAHKRVADAEAP